ncbi:hypothetical protein ACE1ET_17165 [Saccharicrinis sp. FJH62]|uniref:hypothetical protein n=1 Tax=Saccharicrinis sp. FJH62 TaxID=3344657 RepID=UPI0035D44BDE
MKNFLSIIILLTFSFHVSSQSTAFSDQSTGALSVYQSTLLQSVNDGYPISNFSISFNPLGFIQFGPLINAEFGITDNLVFNTHIRLSSLGVLTYVIKAHDDGLDELSGFGYGAGLIYFIGENRSKPYAGIMLDYNKLDCLYARNESWEWSETTKSIVFLFNIGYRFRFEQGFFINTGAFFGAASNKNEWDYTDTSPGSWGSSDYSSRSSKSINPFGMLELTFGIEF